MVTMDDSYIFSPLSLWFLQDTQPNVNAKRAEMCLCVLCICSYLMNSYMQMNCSSYQPLLHGHWTHSLLRGHPLIVIQQLQFQPVVKELCGLSHRLVFVGEARDELQVAVDDPANSWRTADAKNTLSLGSRRWWVPLSLSLCSYLVV